MLIRDDREHAAFSKGVQMDRDGATFREIGVMLAALSALPHRVKRWHASSVRAMLRSRIATEAGIAACQEPLAA